MSLVNRDILIAVIKHPKNTEHHSLSIIPELICLNHLVTAATRGSYSSKLKSIFAKLLAYQKKYGLGVLPLNISNAQVFVQDLYIELLKNNIPLPNNIAEIDLPYTFSDYDQIKNYFVIHNSSMKIPKSDLSFFSKYLPYLGTLVSSALTLGFSFTAILPLAGWGWSLCIIPVFAISKLLTNYADFGNGPERRLLGVGQWLDRKTSGYYKSFGKLSLPRIFLHSLVSAILACSCLLTGFGAWQMVCCLSGLYFVPSLLMTSLALFFACSSTGSTFGRIYNDLYKLLFKILSPHFSFDDIKPAEKITSITVENIALKEASSNEVNKVTHQTIPTSSVLYQYHKPNTTQPRNNQNETHSQQHVLTLR